MDISINYLVDSNGITYGFEILVNGNVVFRQDSAPADVSLWDQATIEAMANKILNNYIETLVRRPKKKQINSDAKMYITEKLRFLDWGNTYEECLSELSNTAQVYETRVFGIISAYDSTFTITKVREYITALINGTLTLTDIQTELTNLGLTTDDITKVINYLTEGLNVAKIMDWIEDVWAAVEIAESSIDSSTDASTINGVSVSFPELSL